MTAELKLTVGDSGMELSTKLGIRIERWGLRPAADESG